MIQVSCANCGTAVKLTPHRATRKQKSPRNFCSRKCHGLFSQNQKSAELTQAALQEVLLYFPRTGKFCWREGVRRRIAGEVAGYSDSLGYITIRVYGKLYLAHRLAWLYSYGLWPKSEIDHANRRPWDNRIANLREATRAQNCYNTRYYDGKGASFCKGRGKWRAYIRVNGRQKHLGHFRTRAEAVEAYRSAAIIYHGEFSSVLTQPEA